MGDDGRGESRDDVCYEDLYRSLEQMTAEFEAMDRPPSRSARWAMIRERIPAITAIVDRDTLGDYLLNTGKTSIEGAKAGLMVGGPKAVALAAALGAALGLAGVQAHTVRARRLQVTELFQNNGASLLEWGRGEFKRFTAPAGSRKR